MARKLPTRLVVAMSSTSVHPGPRVTITHADHQAYRHALELLARADVGGSIQLVHVVDFLDRDLADDDPAKELKDVRTAIVAQLEQACAVGKDRGVEVTYKLVSGTAWYEILRAAHEFAAELIVISPRRSSIGFGDRLLHGSTASRLIRKSQCPIWVVEPLVQEGIKSLLVAVDLGPTSADVIAEANALAEATGAERHLLHCLDYPADMALHRLPESETVVGKYHEAVAGEARTRLETLCDTARWNIHLEGQWVVKAVPKLIARHDIDLVVLGCVSKPWIAGWLLGTSAEKIIERATVSAWVVRPEGWTSPVTFDDAS